MSGQLECSSLRQEVRAAKVAVGQVHAWWLGGAGFIFKTSAGLQIYVDPYLSDVVNHIFGQQRAFPAPILAEDAEPDLVLISHWHEDHLDPEAVPIIARNRPTTPLWMPPSAMARAVSWGLPRQQVVPIKAGQNYQFKDVSVTTVAARHNPGVEGWEVYDPVSLIIETSGLKIFFSGDTEYDASLRNLRRHDFDAAILCINGISGNMNAHEAALLAWHWNVRTVIPMHHQLWANAPDNDDATLDSQLLETTYRRLGGTGQVIHPIPGDQFVLM